MSKVLLSDPLYSAAAASNCENSSLPRGCRGVLPEILVSSREFFLRLRSLGTSGRREREHRSRASPSNVQIERE
jgi:hypothetical protein